MIGTHEPPQNSLTIRDIRPGMRGIRVVARIIRKGQPYEISTRYGPAQVSDAELEDSTRTISWRLWRNQIELAKVGDTVLIENAFVRSFEDRLELNLGADGRIIALQSSTKI